MLLTSTMVKTMHEGAQKGVVPKVPLYLLLFAPTDETCFTGGLQYLLLEPSGVTH